MKRFFALTFFGLMALGAFAQNSSDSLMVSSMLKSMTERLSLTPEQLTRFTPVYTSYLEQVRQISKPEKRAKGDARELTKETAYRQTVARIDRKMRVLDAQKRVIGEMKEILTPEQLVRFLNVDSHIHAQVRNAYKGSWKQRGNR